LIDDKLKSDNYAFITLSCYVAC